MKQFLFNAWSLLQNGLRREEGQGMVEYGLIIALVAIVVILVLVFLGGSIKSIFGHAANVLNNAASNSGT